MKKITVLACALTALFGFQMSRNQAIADNVNLQKAKQVGANYLASQMGVKSISENSMDLVYQINNMQQNIPAVYFFNAGENGFVIVSGSDCVSPILGYSTEGTLDPNNLPPAMVWWYSEYSQQIAYAQNQNLKADQSTSDLWVKIQENKLPSKGNTKAASFLLTTKWNQDDPYNLYSPVINGERCPTGCVATAASQIMRYWQYPKVGKGNNTYWCSSIREYLSVDFSQAHYDYSLMPNRLKSNSTQAQKEETAKLNYHWGVATDMGYEVEGSGTQSTKVVQAAKMYFKYPNKIKMLNRDNWTDTAWADTLASEIQLGRPVYYSGYDASSSGVHAGHAFVCDGFDPDNVVGKTFHFNWGWGGAGDCWCNVIASKLTADPYVFSSNHSIIVNFAPPADSLLSINEVAVDALPMPAYPNPANTVLNIPYHLDGTSSAVLTVYGVDGRIMDSKTVYPTATYIQLNVADYPKGVYIYRLNGVSRKFIVQ